MHGDVQTGVRGAGDRGGQPGGAHGGDVGDGGDLGATGEELLHDGGALPRRLHPGVHGEGKGDTGRDTEEPWGTRGGGVGPVRRGGRSCGPGDRPGRVRAGRRGRLGGEDEGEEKKEGQLGAAGREGGERQGRGHGRRGVLAGVEGAVEQGISV